MADIDIVPKRRTSTWLWIAIVVLVVLAVAFWLLAAEPRPVTGILNMPVPMAITGVFSGTLMT